MENRYSEIDYSRFQEQDISGRYVVLESIEPLLKKLSSKFKIKVEGFSEENQPLYSITFGKGKFKILMWSQMHGNESTTTKAIFDFINYLNADNNLDSKITLKILPMLNPDGALRYTRENANGVDLNRDALNKSQSEIKTLFAVFEDFKPDLCLNMHDQRTIFSAGKTSNPAVVSFLAPSANQQKTITENRGFAMQLIAAMNNSLQKIIPGNIGRYSDEFNPNCLGDTFQSMGVPAILFEAGHYGNDYKREKVREYIFIALWSLFDILTDLKQKLPETTEYFNIPENEKLFFDIIIRNAIYNEECSDIAIQFEEKLIVGNVSFIPKLAKTGNLQSFYGHRTIDASNKEVLLNTKKRIMLDSEITNLTIDSINISMI